MHTLIMENFERDFINIIGKSYDTEMKVDLLGIHKARFKARL